MRSIFTSVLRVTLCVILPGLAHAQNFFQSSFESDRLDPDYFVVAWAEDLCDPCFPDVLARGFENLFPVAAVSDLSAGRQNHPALAVAPDGRFVVAWEDDADGNGLFQIHARVFNPDGSVSIPRFTVNSEAAGQQRDPAVAIAPDGDFVVVWEDDPDGNGFFNLLGRGFFANGTEKFSDRTVANTGAGAERDPAIGMAEDGDFVVTWADDTGYDNLFQIHARGFNANGTQKFARITVNSEGAGQQVQPDIAVAPNGDFVVIFADDADMNWFHQVRARGFNANGTQKFGEFTVNEIGIGDQYWPALGIADDGSFAAVWVDQGQRIMSRLFTADASPLTGDTVMNADVLQYQIQPAVDIAQSGNIVVAWEYQLDDGRFGVKVRRMGADGLLEPEFSVSSNAGGNQMTPRVGAR